MDQVNVNNSEQNNIDAVNNNSNVKSIICETAVIALILIINTIVFALTGYGIPCVFRLFTGYRCPGCGMTHACLELLKGNVRGAAEYNFLSITLMPVLLVFLIYKGIYIIRTGSTKMKTWENIFLIICGIIIVVFFVYRNIPILLSDPFVRSIISK